MKRKLIVATCQFPVSADIKRNEVFILRQIAEVKAKEAEVAHFSESSLSGYAGADLISFINQDGTVLGSSLEKIIRYSAKLKIWVIVGSHQFEDNNKLADDKKSYKIYPDHIKDLCVSYSAIIDKEDLEY